MSEQHIRAAFAARVNELCDALGIAEGHGRQTALGKMFGVTPKGARKWLLGLAYPEMATAVQMCEKAGLNVLWLLQGTPPKRGERIDPSAMAVVEGIQALPASDKAATLEFLAYQFHKNQGWFTGEQVKGYLEKLDDLKRQPEIEPRIKKQTGTDG